MQPDRRPPRPAGIASDRDVDHTVHGEKLPRDGRRQVAQHRAVAARQHRCEPASLTRQRAMADRVDAAVQDVQPPGPNTMIGRVSADAERRQLRPRHDAVLSPREIGERQVLGDLTAHIAVKAPGGEVRPLSARARRGRRRG
jgi:hypothetical protein